MLSKEVAEILAWKGDVSLTKFNDVKKASGDYNKALKIDGNCLKALIGKQQILIKLMRFEEVIKIYDKMIEILPECEEIRLDKI